MSFCFLSYSTFLFPTRVFLTLFILTVLFLFHLIPFSFHPGPKISGRDLLLVEECCNAPDPMRQVSSSYSSFLPCHLLACCILPCHHLHCIIMFSKLASGPFPRCPFHDPTLSLAPVAPLRPCFVSGRKAFSEWAEICRVALV